MKHFITTFSLIFMLLSNSEAYADDCIQHIRKGMNLPLKGAGPDQTFQGVLAIQDVYRCEGGKVCFKGEMSISNYSPWHGVDNVAGRMSGSTFQLIRYVHFFNEEQDWRGQCNAYGIDDGHWEIIQTGRNGNFSAMY